MKNLTFIALVIFSLSSCKKDFNSNSSQGLSLSEFNAQFSITPQTFNGVAGTAFSITGAKGVKIDFPANAFLDAVGNSVSGNVKLSLKEVLSKRDILLSGKFTESNGQLLVSGGEFQILAFQNNQLLKLNSAATVSINVPTTLSKAPMDLFEFKQTAASDSTWVLNQKARVFAAPAYYQFSLPSFGWVNCDYFYSNPNPKTTVAAVPIYAESTPSIKEQRAYMIFDNINTVVGLPFVMSVNKHQSYLNSLPIGMSGKLVIIAVDVNDKIYFGSTSFTVSADLNLNIPVSLATQGTIDNYLGGI